MNRKEFTTSLFRKGVNLPDLAWNYQRLVSLSCSPSVPQELWLFDACVPLHSQWHNNPWLVWSGFPHTALCFRLPKLPEGRFLAVKPKETGIHTALHVISDAGQEISFFLEEVTGTVRSLIRKSTQ
jgi:hypothetical protein